MTMSIADLLEQREVLPPVGFQNECVVWAEQGSVQAMAEMDTFLAQGGSSADAFSILAAIAAATENEIPESLRSTQFFSDRFIDMDPVFRVVKAAQ